MVLVAFACAIITQAIGLHAVFGAFVAGLMLNRAPRVRPATARRSKRSRWA